MQWTRARLAAVLLLGLASVGGMDAATGRLGRDDQAPQPAAPPAGQAPAQGAEQVFRAGVNFVRVDVIATDKQGNPVTDLTQDDFEIIEDNTKQSIETFRLVKIDLTAPVETPGRLQTRAD